MSITIHLFSGDILTVTLLPSPDNTVEVVSITLRHHLQANPTQISLFKKQEEEYEELKASDVLFPGNSYYVLVKDCPLYHVRWVNSQFVFYDHEKPAFKLIYDTLLLPIHPEEKYIQTTCKDVWVKSELTEEHRERLFRSIQHLTADRLLDPVRQDDSMETLFRVWIEAIHHPFMSITIID